LPRPTPFPTPCSVVSFSFFRKPMTSLRLTSSETLLWLINSTEV
jgi:hypothetical protein